MELMPIFRLGLMNAWWLILPMVLPMAYLAATKKEVAARMSDMTGYYTREKFFTVAASLAPYPFMISIGVASFITTIRVFVTTPLDKPFSAGIYRISRNPLYVSATLIFFGICLVTANVLLFAWLVIIVVPQHFMILAEERVCREKYGTEFERYMAKVPRYLLL